MQHSCSDTSIKESRQSASSVTRECKQVHFLLRSEIDNCRHYGAEHYMDMCSYPLLSKAGFKSFKVSPRIF